MESQAVVYLNNKTKRAKMEIKIPEKIKSKADALAYIKGPDLEDEFDESLWDAEVRNHHAGFAEGYELATAHAAQDSAYLKGKIKWLESKVIEKEPAIKIEISEHISAQAARMLLEKQNTRLKEENKIMRETLKNYRDIHKDILDGGKRDRACLVKLNKEEE
jgi:hypothetical protein